MNPSPAESFQKPLYGDAGFRLYLAVIVLSQAEVAAPTMPWIHGRSPLEKARRSSAAQNDKSFAKAGPIIPGFETTCSERQQNLYHFADGRMEPSKDIDTCHS
jgi:hypothetical protein